MIGARNHPHTAFNPAAISDPYDFNRIQLITAPAMLQAMDLPVGNPLGQIGESEQRTIED